MKPRNGRSVPKSAFENSMQSHIEEDERGGGGGDHVARIRSNLNFETSDFHILFKNQAFHKYTAYLVLRIYFAMSNFRFYC